MSLLSGISEQNSQFVSFFTDTLRGLSIWLGELLSQIKNGDGLLPIFILLGVSFAYGFAHASGPGHGKTLVASYFVSNDKSYKKGITIAALIALIHTFSALLAAIVGYFVFSSIFSVAVSNIALFGAKISGGLIVLLGVYFLYNKIRHYKNISKPTPKWSLNPQGSCGCASCKSKDASELVVVLSAGLIPCPGTITVFLFSISLGLYFIGFLSALTMSIGMGVVIAITAAVSVKARNSGKSRFSKFMIYVDFGATLMIILLGLILIL